MRVRFGDGLPRGPSFPDVFGSTAGSLPNIHFMGPFIPQNAPSILRSPDRSAIHRDVPPLSERIPDLYSASGSRGKNCEFRLVALRVSSARLT